MNKQLGLLLSLSGLLQAADLKPDSTTDIPESAKRPVVVTRGTDHSALSAPKAELPPGMELLTVAAAPLVTHPIMGCLDDKGRLFIGDATGVNWNKKQLEENPPNRVLMLEDTDGDGVFDKSTIFADKMTFPQGACWLDGSLYVCSPPGLWKLTDTDGDGVADKRELIVSGFDYTGNAADVHGPFLHPNGRLYWCHGRKGHKVIGKEGTVVHDGLASGIWSCKPDGSDVQWHSLGCGDNPVEVDFTPEGEVIGVQNLYYSQPRGDTLVHWIYGGIYDRPDQLKAIEGLPRTLEHMPVMYNFGHVAVSGCCFARKGALFPGSPLPFLVTHFNTQSVVRMDLTPEGATYKATENQFLKLHDADIHLTDIMEDKDGSLLVLNTGGWFRIGCPSSLMAKPDIAGAIYRVRKTGAATAPAVAAPDQHEGKRSWEIKDEAEARAQLAAHASTHATVHACEWIALHHAAEEATIAELVKLLAQPLDPAMEHIVMHALIASDWSGLSELQKKPGNPALVRRLLVITDQTAQDGATQNVNLGIASEQLDAADPDLARVALNVVTRHAEADELVSPVLAKWLASAKPSTARLKALEGFCEALIAKPETQKLVSRMLAHKTAAVRQAALRVLASQTASATNKEWLKPLSKLLDEATGGKGSMSALLDALKKLKDESFNPKLQAIANDAKQPLPLRLKALDAMKGGKITPETFALLQSVLTGSASSSASRIQAAAMLAAAPLDTAQLTTLAPLLATVGPIELKELIKLPGKTKDVPLVKLMAEELAKNPSLISQQESVYRTVFSSKPPEIFDTLVLPALHKADEAIDAKKRLLVPLADKATSTGDPIAGRTVYESGRGTCIACHQIGDKGRPIGPNLSKIGAIRTERDIVESVLFPSNTLARDYEAHLIETSDGQSITGVIKSHTAEGLLVVDAAGQEKNLPNTQIVSDTQLTTSLMPMGLDLTLPEKDLLDLVAFLRSLK